MKKFMGILAVILLVGCGTEGIKDQDKEVSGEVVTDIPEPVKEEKEIQPATKTIEGKDENGEDIIAYHWHNIEALPKAETYTQAIETIFGKDRYYYDYSEEAINKMTELFKNDDGNSYITVTSGDEERELFYGTGLTFDVTMNLDVDPRMQMVDFFHYLKVSDLIKEESEQYGYGVRMYNEREPGMNYSEPSFIWSLDSKTIAEMNFNDKTSIYKNIYMYGNYEGMYPNE